MGVAGRVDRTTFGDWQLLWVVDAVASKSGKSGKNRCLCREEHQAGEFFHDETLTDHEGHFDSLPEFRRNLKTHAAEDVVIPVVSTSATLAEHWTTPLGFLFIDGGHSLQAALTDYRNWSQHVQRGGLLVIHDVFTSASEGGQAPHAIWRLARQSGLFEEVGALQSLRALRRL